MPNGKYNRDTFTGAQDVTQKGMLFDMIEGLHDKVDQIKLQPPICDVVMDDKIKAERKLRRKINLGIGGGGGIGVVAAFEFIRSFWPK